MKFSKDVVLPWFICLFVFVSFLFCVKHLILNRWPSVQLRHLDRLRPEKFEPFCNHPQGDILNLYQKYFENVDVYFKHANAQALGLLGYCAFQRQDWEKAGKYYQKALRLEPGFFWYAYNQAICFLKQEKYDEAMRLLERSLSMDQRQSIMFIVLSKQMYAPIVSACFEHPGPESLVRQMEDARQKAKDILLLLRMKLNRMPVDVSTGELTIAFY